MHSVNIQWNKLFPWQRAIIRWVIVIGLGLFLLAGRYPWSADLQHARIGYFCSAYFFIIVTPVLFYLVKELSHNPGLALLAAGAWWVAATLPYRWLKLDRLFYPLEKLFAPDYVIKNLKILTTQPDWFPQALENLPAIPHESLLFTSLIAFGIALAVVLIRLYPGQKKILILGLFTYFLVLLETWLHLSRRSPYLYYTLWDPAFSKRFFVTFLFPDGRGAVNQDFGVFRALELLFMGKPYATDLLFRRSFYSYVSSQFSYFINTYYICLVMNISLWLSAVVCGYLFARRHWPERVALLSAGFIASGTGFIMFVAQPMNYLAYYASIIILVYLFDRLVIEGNQNIAGSILFAGILGLALLNYDLFPFYIYLIGYGIFKKINWKVLSAVILIGICIYGGLLLLYTRGLGVAMQTGNSDFATSPLTVFLQWAGTATTDQWYIKFRELFGQFFLNMGNAFLVIIPVLALPGLLWLKEPAQKRIIFYLFLPAILIQAALQFGGTKFTSYYLYELPRLFYIVYPAMYFLAALFLDQLGQGISAKKLSQAAAVIPWVGLAVIILLNNIDVWGVPSLYYHFYFSATGAQFLK